ncbi:MAG: AI-2E family transporter [Acidimicrobiales bacterium]
MLPGHVRAADRGDSAGHAPGSPGGEGGPASPWREVPWRTIVAVIGLVSAVALVVLVVHLASRVVVWVAIGGFFAVVLSRPVGYLERRCHLRRGLAIGVVVGLALATAAGIVTLFVMPVRTQLLQVLSDMPGTVSQAVNGEGPVGRVVYRLRLEGQVRDNQAWLIDQASRLEASLPGMAARTAQGLVTVLTVTVMTCLFLGQSAAIGRTASLLVPVRHRGWVTVTTLDAGRAVSGYMIGNLIISVCAGVASFVFLFVLGVPAALVLALFVAVADLVPLVGATVGAAAAVLGALLVSPGAGIAAVVFFVIYQQFENFVLAPMVMARTVKINPLVTLLSVLLGVELFGFDGALLAVPMAGALNVIVKELWCHRPTAPDELVVVRE